MPRQPTIPNEPVMEVNLTRLYSLLKMTEPVPDEYDVMWHGPYYVPRARQWHPSHFLLYGGKLFCTLQMAWKGLSVVWDIGKRKTVSDPSVRSPGGEEIWSKAIPQLERKLGSALANPRRYNRHVARWLPPECRTGRIERRLSWPKGVTPMPGSQLDELGEALVFASHLPAMPNMTVNAYLEIASLAYDAAFPETRHFSASKKHERWADTRHGGMLDLPPEDAEAFDQWFQSGAWRGTHPWEIVFAHPHGILLSPVSRSELGGWRFYLSVDTEGLYVKAAQMALALSQAKIPFELYRGEEVLAALRGVDTVEIGSAFGQIAFNDLLSERTDVIDDIEWDPIAEIQPISKAGRTRVRHVEKTGSPARLEDEKPG